VPGIGTGTLSTCQCMGSSMNRRYGPARKDAASDLAEACLKSSINLDARKIITTLEGLAYAAKDAVPCLVSALGKNWFSFSGQRPETDLSKPVEGTKQADSESIFPNCNRLTCPSADLRRSARCKHCRHVF